jgi:hypothetical protein
MSGKTIGPGRNPVLPTVDQTFSLPDWQDGEFPYLGRRVLIIREVASNIVCSAVVTPRMSVKEMVQDYVGLRAFERSETQLAMTFEVVANGKKVEPETRAIASRTGRRTTLRSPVRDIQWARALRANRDRPPLRSQWI